MRWTQQVSRQRIRLGDLEIAIAHAKAAYKEAMLNLSRINEEIHDKRDKQRQKRRQQRNSSAAAFHLRSPSSSSSSSSKKKQRSLMLNDQQQHQQRTKEVDKRMTPNTPNTPKTTTTMSPSNRQEIFLIDPILKHLAYTNHKANLKSK